MTGVRQPLRRFSWTLGCFTDSGGNAPIEESKDKLATCISNGDYIGFERTLRKSKITGDVIITIKRKHLKPTVTCWLDRNTDPFLQFYQECSAIIYVIDCQQWSMLSILARYGLDPNRPVFCRRKPNHCSPNFRTNASPFKSIWVRGKYTYQSALDYFFASVYECLGDYMARCTDHNGSAPLLNHLKQLPCLLDQGLDVHRIDSVIIFNCLASSFDWFLSRYTNEEAVVPDLPETSDAYLELITVRTLIENGFSQFECMEYFSSCHNWFGILLSVLCHPKIDSYGNDNYLPDIIRQAALLLINFLALHCTILSKEDFEEHLENLQLRKLYSKRYADHRDLFNQRLCNIQKNCIAFKYCPQSLRFAARNVIRKYIKGVHFKRKLATLPLPLELQHFIAYVEVDHIRSASFPPEIVQLAYGKNIYVTDKTATNPS